MDRTITLTELERRLADLPYPVGQELAATLLDDTTLVLSDGEVNLGEILAASDADRFRSAQDAASEVRARLPRHTVGELAQGDG